MHLLESLLIGHTLSPLLIQLCLDKEQLIFSQVALAAELVNHSFHLLLLVADVIFDLSCLLLGLLLGTLLVFQTADHIFAVTVELVEIAEGLILVEHTCPSLLLHLLSHTT